MELSHYEPTPPNVQQQVHRAIQESQRNGISRLLDVLLAKQRSMTKPVENTGGLLLLSPP
jgi:hypothetical protein